MARITVLLNSLHFTDPMVGRVLANGLRYRASDYLRTRVLTDFEVTSTFKLQTLRRSVAAQVEVVQQAPLPGISRTAFAHHLGLWIDEMLEEGPEADLAIEVRVTIGLRSGRWKRKARKR